MLMGRVGVRRESFFLFLTFLPSSLSLSCLPGFFRKAERSLTRLLPRVFLNSGHNDLGKWLLLFALPNCLWIIIPGIIAGVFGNEIVKVLRSSSPATTTKKSKKVKSI